MKQSEILEAQLRDLEAKAAAKREQLKKATAAEEAKMRKQAFDRLSRLAAAEKQTPVEYLDRAERMLEAVKHLHAEYGKESLEATVAWLANVHNSKKE